MGLVSFFEFVVLCIVPIYVLIIILFAYKPRIDPDLRAGLPQPTTTTQTPQQSHSNTNDTITLPSLCGVSRTLYGPYVLYILPPVTSQISQTLSLGSSISRHNVEHSLVMSPDSIFTCSFTRIIPGLNSTFQNRLVFSCAIESYTHQLLLHENRNKIGYTSNHGIGSTDSMSDDSSSYDNLPSTSWCPQCALSNLSHSHIHIRTTLNENVNMDTGPITYSTTLSALLDATSTLINITLGRSKIKDSSQHTIPLTKSSKNMTNTIGLQSNIGPSDTRGAVEKQSDNTLSTPLNHIDDLWVESSLVGLRMSYNKTIPRDRSRSRSRSASSSSSSSSSSVVARSQDMTPSSSFSILVDPILIDYTNNLSSMSSLTFSPSIYAQHHPLSPLHLIANNSFYLSPYSQTSHCTYWHFFGTYNPLFEQAVYIPSCASYASAAQLTSETTSLSQNSLFPRDISFNHIDFLCDVLSRQDRMLASSSSSSNLTYYLDISNTKPLHIVDICFLPVHTGKIGSQQPSTTTRGHLRSGSKQEPPAPSLSSSSSSSSSIPFKGFHSLVLILLSSGHIIAFDPLSASIIQTQHIYTSVQVLIKTQSRGNITQDAISPRYQGDKLEEVFFDPFRDTSGGIGAGQSGMHVETANASQLSQVEDSLIARYMSAPQKQSSEYALPSYQALPYHTEGIIYTSFSPLYSHPLQTSKSVLGMKISSNTLESTGYHTPPSLIVYTADSQISFPLNHIVRDLEDRLVRPTPQGSGIWPSTVLHYPPALIGDPSRSSIYPVPTPYAQPLSHGAKSTHHESLLDPLQRFPRQPKLDQRDGNRSHPSSPQPEVTASPGRTSLVSLPSLSDTLTHTQPLSLSNQPHPQSLLSALSSLASEPSPGNIGIITMSNGNSNYNHYSGNSSDNELNMPASPVDYTHRSASSNSNIHSTIPTPDSMSLPLLVDSNYLELSRETFNIVHNHASDHHVPFLTYNVPSRMSSDRVNNTLFVPQTSQIYHDSNNNNNNNNGDASSSSSSSLYEYDITPTPSLYSLFTIKNHALMWDSKWSNMLTTHQQSSVKKTDSANTELDNTASSNHSSPSSTNNLRQTEHTSILLPPRHSILVSRAVFTPYIRPRIHHSISKQVTSALYSFVSSWWSGPQNGGETDGHDSKGKTSNNNKTKMVLSYLSQVSRLICTEVRPHTSSSGLRLLPFLTLPRDPLGRLPTTPWISLEKMTISSVSSPLAPSSSTNSSLTPPPPLITFSTSSSPSHLAPLHSQAIDIEQQEPLRQLSLYSTINGVSYIQYIEPIPYNTMHSIVLSHPVPRHRLTKLHNNDHDSTNDNTSDHTANPTTTTTDNQRTVSFNDIPDIDAGTNHHDNDDVDNDDTIIHKSRIDELMVPEKSKHESSHRDKAHIDDKKAHIKYDMVSVKYPLLALYYLGLHTIHTHDAFLTLVSQLWYTEQQAGSNTQQKHQQHSRKRSSSKSGPSSSLSSFSDYLISVTPNLHRSLYPHLYHTRSSYNSSILAALKSSLSASQSSTTKKQSTRSSTHSSRRSSSSRSLSKSHHSDHPPHTLLDEYISLDDLVGQTLPVISRYSLRKLVNDIAKRLPSTRSLSPSHTSGLFGEVHHHHHHRNTSTPGSMAITTTTNNNSSMISYDTPLLQNIPINHIISNSIVCCKDTLNRIVFIDTKTNMIIKMMKGYNSLYTSIHYSWLIPSAINYDNTNQSSSSSWDQPRALSSQYMHLPYPQYPVIVIQTRQTIQIWALDPSHDYSLIHLSSLDIGTNACIINTQNESYPFAPHQGIVADIFLPPNPDLHPSDGHKIDTILDHQNDNGAHDQFDTTTNSLPSLPSPDTNTMDDSIDLLHNDTITLSSSTSLSSTLQCMYILTNLVVLQLNTGMTNLITISLPLGTLF